MLLSYIEQVARLLGVPTPQHRSVQGLDSESLQTFYAAEAPALSSHHADDATLARLLTGRR